MDNDKYCIVRIRHNYDSESLEYKLLNTAESIESAHDVAMKEPLENGDLVAVAEIEYVSDIIGNEDCLYVVNNGHIIKAPDDPADIFFQCSWLDAWYGDRSHAANMMEAAEKYCWLPKSKLISAACECVRLSERYMRQYAIDALREIESSNKSVYPLDMLDLKVNHDAGGFDAYYATRFAETAVSLLSNYKYREAVNSSASAIEEGCYTNGYANALAMAPLVRKHISLAELIANIRR